MVLPNHLYFTVWLQVVPRLGGAKSQSASDRWRKQKKKDEPATHNQVQHHEKVKGNEHVQSSYRAIAFVFISLF